MKSNNDFDAILDNVTADIRNEQIDPSVVDAAAERVWTLVSAEGAGQLHTQTAAAERIESCADFQSLIPAYLHGGLSEARSLLLVDHTHECIPCRKAMKEARTRTIAPVRKAVANRRYHIQPVVMRWGIAAALVIGFGLLALPFIQRYAPLWESLKPLCRRLKVRSIKSPILEARWLPLARSYSAASIFAPPKTRMLSFVLATAR